MLELVIKEQEVFNAEDNTFSTTGWSGTLQLEHSLVSMSKWEAIFEKPFLAAGEKTREETLVYVGCMILTPGIDPNVANEFSNRDLRAVDEYIVSKQSATTFGDLPKRNKSSGETITSELVYYWMVAFNIPFECQTWHLNRLFSLIRILNLKQDKPQKMSRAEIARRNSELNEKRKAQLGTSG